MSPRYIYWRFLGVHVLTGWAAALLFSLGVTYVLAASNPFLLVMSGIIPILDVLLSKRYLRQLQPDAEEETPSSISANRILVLSVTGFGIGILIHLITVLAVFR